MSYCVIVHPYIYQSSLCDWLLQKCLSLLVLAEKVKNFAHFSQKSVVQFPLSIGQETRSKDKKMKSVEEFFILNYFELEYKKKNS
jgi:hypothetical protein